VGAALLALFAFTSVLRANLYEIAFTDPGANNVGTGQIDVEGGYAVSGNFDVTAGAAIGAWEFCILLAGTGGTWDSQLTSPLGGVHIRHAVYLNPDSNPQYPVRLIWTMQVYCSQMPITMSSILGRRQWCLQLLCRYKRVKYDPAVIPGFQRSPPFLNRSTTLWLDLA